MSTPTIKAQVKAVFTQPPASFVFEKDDTKAVMRGAATLQCPRDNKATLICVMHPDRLDVVQWNTNLLVLLCLATGWKDGDVWLTGQMRLATQLQLAGAKAEATYQGRTYNLIIDRVNYLMTLVVEEP